MNLIFNKTFKSCCTWLLFGFLFMGFSPDAIAHYLTIKNEGDCAVNIYHWVTTGDVYKTTIQPGQNYRLTGLNGYKYRAVDTNNDWNNLTYDQSYMLNNNTYQTWTINPNYCSNVNTGACSGAITGFLLNKQDGSALGNLTNGASFCESDFPNDIRIRTKESGTHESLRYTITGPTGTWSNVENVVTYDSKQFWPTPGEWTIKAELFKADNASGTECDEKIIKFNITDCTNNSPCDNVTSGGLVEGDETVCSGIRPARITNLEHASGGSDIVEYQWLSSTTGCPDQLEQAIQGATGSSYRPNVITQTTYYLRCARRAGCTSWDFGESNCIKKTVTDAPVATVAKSDPTCGINDGKFTFTFGDNVGRTNIEFSIDGGTTYIKNVKDDIGSTMISNLGNGSYDLYVRWGNDECPVSLGTLVLTDGSQAPGTDCNDNNANTTNDVILADGCSCAGTVPAPVYDCPQLEANIGDACNDGNANTNNDVVTANCGCAGTIAPPVYDCPQLEANIGDACDDGNALTLSDVVTANCGCAGTIPTPVYDCPALSANIGDSCNDGNATTENDVVTADCGCEGTQINIVLPSILINSVVVNEADGTASLTVGIDQVSATDVVVDFVTNDGTAIAGVDYAALNGTITIPAGQQSVTLTFDILEDTTDETDELFNVILSNPQGAVIVGGVGSVTILDNDEPAVPGGCAAAYTVDGNVITITGVTGSIKTVKVLDEGWNSVFTCDEWSSVCNETESVTIPSCGTYYVQVQTYADWSTPICNLFETVVITDGCGTGVDCPGLGLNFGASCDDGNANTINDVVKEDCGCYGTPVGPQLDCPALNANIGDACDDFNPNTNNDVVQADCTCAGSAGPSTCGVTYTVDGKDILVENISGAIRSVKVLDENWGTIFACDDWSTQCGTTESITVPSCGKYFLQVHTYADWSTTICDLFETVEINNDCGVTPIVPNVSIDDVVVNEADGTASLTIAIDQIIGTDVVVDYGTTDGTAIAGVDYAALTGTVTIPAGQQFVTVTFDILEDTTDEADEIFNVVLSNPQGAVISGNIGTVTILDNDVAGPIDCDPDCSPTVYQISTGTNGVGSPMAFGFNPSKVYLEFINGTGTLTEYCDGRAVISGDLVATNNPLTGCVDGVYHAEWNLENKSSYDEWIALGRDVKSRNCNDFEDFLYYELASATLTGISDCNREISLTIAHRPATIQYGFQIGNGAHNNGIDCNFALGGWYTWTAENAASEAYFGAATGPGDWHANLAQPVSDETACNDGNNGTYDDKYDADCNCVGKPLPTAPAPGFDCPALGANIGSACDDGDATTNNDLVQADCSCAGMPMNNTQCAATYTVDGRTITVNNVTGAITAVKIIDNNWGVLYECNDWATPCQETEAFTVPTCGTYFVQVQTYADWSTIVCNLFETVVIDADCDGGSPVCDNVTDGGAIAGDETIEAGTAAGAITNATLPSGGSGAIEYQWLSATDRCPRFITQAIPGANQSTYEPGVLTETTYFVRCSRRAGCTETTSWTFGESNCVVKEVVAATPINVCADRVVFNAQSCRTGVDYGVWLQGEPFAITDGKFVEFNDGTALFTAHANGIGAVEVRFSGRTIESVNPKHVICGDTVSTNGWYYYASFEGTIGSHTISQRGPSFQVGVSANQQNQGVFGACAWFDTHDGLKGDINILLDGDQTACIGVAARMSNTSFNAEMANGQVQLDWTNNTGSVTDNFEVERSVDGVSFETIGTYDVISLDDTPRFYASEDGSPLEGFNYYRLKVNYLDGSFEYSEIRTVKISDIEEFGLFPNPAREHVNVSLKGYTGKDINIQLIDQMGQAVKSIQLENVEDNNYTIDLGGLTNGMYSFWIFAEGTKPVGKKMIVNKQY